MTVDHEGQQRETAPEIKQISSDAFEFKALTDQGDFEGYASTFGNIDGVGDIVSSDAFNKTLREAKKTGKYPKLLWQHRFDSPIGVITEMRKDGTGLLIKGRLNLDVSKGKEAHSLLKQGAMDSMSIGYYVMDCDVDAKTGVRTIKDLKLWEVSLVTFPANEKAVVTGVKSKPVTEREFERFLRDEGGFSQSEAKTIVAKGFKAIGQRDVDAAEAAEICRAIKQNINILKV